MAVVVVFLVFVPIAAICFARLPLRSAILTVLIGGWWLLPVGHYSPGGVGTSLPWWITGTALPSDMLLTKAWIPPLVSVLGGALRDWESVRTWRPEAIDAPMAFWCVWPLLDGFGGAPTPAPWLATLYICGSWGLPWLIGRLWFAGRDGCLSLTRAIAFSGLANLPVAVIEGTRPPMLYGLIYGPHPFRFDGIARFVGYRPIGFLEHGNLYGLWTAIAAFAAVWLVGDRGRKGGGWIALAIANVVVMLASQSTGAIILFVVGLAVLAMWRSRDFPVLMVVVAVALLLVGAIHLSGVVPLQAIARSPAGENVIGMMRATGRGSFLWRVSQDTKTLASIHAHLIGGTAQWDWWRPYRTRPWGQPFLLIGQYGVVGLLLAWGSLLGACIAAFARLRKWQNRLAGDAALALALVVLIALADATLNAFFFSPAILAAGAIAGWPMMRR